MKFSIILQINKHKIKVKLEIKKNGIQYLLFNDILLLVLFGLTFLNCFDLVFDQFINLAGVFPDKLKQKYRY
ncbi:hypothetical protein Hanom_Chr09g00801791 [Helianthus anomalus]